MINPKIASIYCTVLSLGITIDNLILYLRFANPILRKELIDYMNRGNEYFLLFFYFSLIFTLILVGLTVYFNRQYITKDKNYWRRKNDKKTNIK